MKKNQRVDLSDWRGGLEWGRFSGRGENGFHLFSGKMSLLKPMAMKKIKKINIVKYIIFNWYN